MKIRNVMILIAVFVTVFCALGADTNTQGTIIIFPAKGDPQNIDPINNNFSNLLVRVDGIYSNASTPNAESVNLWTQRVVNMKAPVDPLDGVNKTYADTLQMQATNVVDWAKFPAIVNPDLDGNVVSGFPVTNTLYVSPAGNVTNDGTSLAPYAGINQALTNITDSGTFNPYSVLVFDGIYAEPPMTIPDDVTVKTEGGADRTIVVPLNPNTNLFTIAGRGGIEGLLISSVTNANAIDFRGAGIFWGNDITFVDCQRGFVISNANAIANLTDLSIGNSGISTECVVELWNGKVVLNHLNLGT